MRMRDATICDLVCVCRGHRVVRVLVCILVSTTSDFRIGTGSDLQIRIWKRCHPGQVAKRKIAWISKTRLKEAVSLFLGGDVLGSLYSDTSAAGVTQPQ